MYTAPQKKFSSFKEEDVLNRITHVGKLYGDAIHRVFLADGDAMVLSTA